MPRGVGCFLFAGVALTSGPAMLSQLRVLVFDKIGRGLVAVIGDHHLDRAERIGAAVARAHLGDDAGSADERQLRQGGSVTAAARAATGDTGAQRDYCEDRGT